MWKLGRNGSPCFAQNQNLSPRPQVAARCSWARSAAVGPIWPLMKVNAALPSHRHFGTGNLMRTERTVRIMRIGKSRSVVINAASLAIMELSAAGAAQATDGLMYGYASWQAQGQRSSSDRGDEPFTGELSGRVYLETPKGPEAAATMRCRVTLVARASDNRQTGAGSCTISANDGAQARAEI